MEIIFPPQLLPVSLLHLPSFSFLLLPSSSSLFSLSLVVFFLQPALLLSVKEHKKKEFQILHTLRHSLRHSNIIPYIRSFYSKPNN
jgi:hypothetical protein